MWANPNSDVSRAVCLSREAETLPSTLLHTRRTRGRAIRVAPRMRAFLAALLLTCRGALMILRTGFGARVRAKQRFLAKMFLMLDSDNWPRACCIDTLTLMALRVAGSPAASHGAVTWVGAQRLRRIKRTPHLRGMLARRQVLRNQSGAKNFIKIIEAMARKSWLSKEFIIN